MEKQLQAGVITSTHGIRGEVKVYPTTDHAQRFRQLKNVYIDTGKEQIPAEIEHVKFFKQFAILKFKGIDDINDVEKYRGMSIMIDRDDAQPLGENEYYIGDIIGMDVYTDLPPAHFGVVRDVMETGANDVYVIESDHNGEVLVPAIRQCILSVDVEKNEMKIHLMEGLLP